MPSPERPADGPPGTQAIHAHARAVTLILQRTARFLVNSRMPLSIALLLLLAVMAALVFLILRGQNLRAQRDRFFAERKLVQRAACPPEVGQPFVYKDLSNLVCYDGPLAADRPLPFVFILGSRQREGAVGPGQKMITDHYIGAYLPSASLRLDDAWLQGWARRVAERADGWAKQSGQPVAPRDHGLMGPPESMPIRAVRTSDGGVLIAWHCLHLRDRFEGRLAELLETLPR